MYFQPIDEMALRHLFSSKYGEDVLRMVYLGPVLTSSGKIADSPDCLILDRSEERWERLRCEFKHHPSSKKDFVDNGQFDIAVVWKTLPPSDKQTLSDELRTQNGCRKILILSEEPAFANLPEYRVPEASEFNGVDEVERVILVGVKGNTAYPTVFAAFIAASIYPDTFGIERMVSTLSNRFPEVKRMLPRGRANVVAKLLMTKTPLLERMYAGTYRWTSAINANQARQVIERLIRTHFRREVPGSEDINPFIV